MGRSINSANKWSSDSDEITEAECCAGKINGGLRGSRQQCLRTCPGEITGNAPAHDIRQLTARVHLNDANFRGDEAVKLDGLMRQRIESGLRMWCNSSPSAHLDGKSSNIRSGKGSRVSHDAMVVGIERRGGRRRGSAKRVGDAVLQILVPNL